MWLPGPRPMGVRGACTKYVRSTVDRSVADTTHASNHAVSKDKQVGKAKEGCLSWLAGLDCYKSVTGTSNPGPDSPITRDGGPRWPVLPSLAENSVRSLPGMGSYMPCSARKRQPRGVAFALRQRAAAGPGSITPAKEETRFETTVGSTT